MADIRFLLAQIAPKLGRVQENLKAHLQILADARERQADIVVFPELSLTGYQLKDLVTDVGLSQAELCQLFSELGKGRTLEAVVGYMERSTGFHYYNAMAHLQIDAAGDVRLLHNHRKLNPPTYGMFEEERFFTQGTQLRAYDSPLLGRCGMLICEDFWHAANTLVLSVDGPDMEGVDVMLVGSNSPARGVDKGRDYPKNAMGWQTLSRYVALTANCLVAVSQRVGVEDGFVFVGGSEIIAPGGEALTAASLFEETQTVCDVNLKALIRENRIALPDGALEDISRLQREIIRIEREQGGN
jgi:predicted amidohydrolase